MDKKPDALFIVDAKVEKTAVQEANHQNIPVVALCDTNVNPDKMKHIVPANDDAVKSVSIVLDQVTQAIAEGQKAGNQLVDAAAKKPEKVAAKKEEKPEEKEDLKVTEDSKAAMEELDLKLHDQILSEKQEEEKKK